VLWSPSIREALLGCGTSKAIDLRIIDRHPLASVGTLVLVVPPGSAPMPKLVGLFALPPSTRADAVARLPMNSS
jgi:hypothetical protein